MPPLDLSIIESRLETRWLGRPSNSANELWDSIASTNTRAKELAALGAPMGTLVLARQQTAGRGRLGRTWESPPDAGIYMSIILRSEDRAIYEIPLLTIAAGVAAVRAIEKATNVSIGLKWVNDLICDGCKVGGILAEASGARSPFVVLGMGINVRLDPLILPEELRSKVTSLHLHAADAKNANGLEASGRSGETIDSNAIVANICLELEKLWEQLESSQSDYVLNEWKRNSVTLGQRIRAAIGEKIIEGTAEDLTTSGALKVRTDDGSLFELSAGEIQVRRADGAYC